MIKNNLKIIIEEKGLKQRYVAEKIGIQPNYFSMIVNGKHMPSIEIALKLSEVLGVSLEDIFYINKEK